jgi:hypothetical protein
MDAGAALALAAVIAVLLGIALAKPTKTLVGGIFMKDKKGRLVLILTPTKRKKRKKK